MAAIDEATDPNLYSSTTHLLPNEERSLAAQLAQSMGLISDRQIVRYHPSISGHVATCILMILIQISFAVLGYFLPIMLPAKWLAFAWAMMAVASFLLAMIAYYIHHLFTRALKARGYLLIRPQFQALRRLPFFIAAFYMVVDLSGFAALQLLCPKALSNPMYSKCEGCAVLNRPYWLLYFGGIVGQAGLLVVFHLALCVHLILFHRRALRGRALPDVLSELAQLNASTNLNEAGGESMAPGHGPPAINADGDVAEMHARIVDIIDHSSSNESLSRVVMERQADVLFYMHQRIACLQEELGRRQPEA